MTKPPRKSRARVKPRRRNFLDERLAAIEKRLTAIEDKLSPRIAAAMAARPRRAHGPRRWGCPRA